VNDMTTNVFDYFKQNLNVAPDDASLRNVPLESNCGVDCKGAIDATKQFLHYHALAYGQRPALHEQMTEMCESIVTTFWRG